MCTTTIQLSETDDSLIGKGATGFVSRIRMTRNDASKLFIAKQQVVEKSLSES